MRSRTHDLEGFFCNHRRCPVGRRGDCGASSPELVYSRSFSSVYASQVDFHTQPLQLCYRCPLKGSWRTCSDVCESGRSRACIG